MIGRLVLAALLAGLCAGLLLSLIQHVRTTPLILAAETFEKSGHDGHDHAQDHNEGEADWQPADGWQRTLSTTATTGLAGAGFALVLAAASILSGIPISRANSLIWGLCGFIAFSLAPSAGLPPELPGMPVADLLPRQIWWTATVAATAGGLYLLATRATVASWAIAAALMAAPHIIGAPQPSNDDSAVPAAIASAFASNTLAANAIFWCLIAVFLSIALQKLQHRIATS
jgi:cobalt transporter subunit CbtA